MKNRFLSAIAMVTMLVGVATPAFGQLDMFGQPRFVVLDSGTTIITTTAAITVTNNPVDIHGFEGVAAIYLSCLTNSSSSTGVSNLPSYWVEQSSDLTNWSQLTACAVASSASSVVTFMNSATNNLLATNVYLLPGTVTTPVASTAGFASQYLSPAAFTSTSSVFTNSTSGGTAVIGFFVGDAKRYLRTASRVPSGTNNSSFSAILIARKQY